MKQIHHHEFKVKGSSWDFGNEASDLVGAGFSWPPRSYICSFCKREFRSAQALGGHMNVHRRDRARLRQSPEACNGKFLPLNLNLDPNPNPSLTPNPTPFSSLLTKKFPHFTSMKFPPLPAETKEFKKRDFVRLDLEIGLISTESKEELDLELRLGYT